MNAWERARIKRDVKNRYVEDENRIRTEGARPLPWACHDYPPQPKTSPGLKVRINAAIGRMECLLGESNGDRNDGTR
jgi:hypothetical protein